MEQSSTVHLLFETLTTIQSLEELSSRILSVVRYRQKFNLFSSLETVMHSRPNLLERTAEHCRPIVL